MSGTGRHYEIAKITSTALGYEDHGIFTCVLHVDYGGTSQGVGGYALDRYDEDKRVRVGSVYGMEFIARILRAAGVERWEQLKGRTIFVVREHKGWGAKVLGICNLPTEPGEEFLFDSIKGMP
jgi:hypothetical protein